MVTDGHREACERIEQRCCAAWRSWGLQACCQKSWRKLFVTHQSVQNVKNGKCVILILIWCWKAASRPYCCQFTFWKMWESIYFSPNRAFKKILAIQRETFLFCGTEVRLNYTELVSGSGSTFWTWSSPSFMLKDEGLLSASQHLSCSQWILTILDQRSNGRAWKMSRAWSDLWLEESQVNWRRRVMKLFLPGRIHCRDH